jgi:hypothetical protein
MLSRAHSFIILYAATLPLEASRIFMWLREKPAMILASTGSDEMKTSPCSPCQHFKSMRAREAIAIVLEMNSLPWLAFVSFARNLTKEAGFVKGGWLCTHHDGDRRCSAVQKLHCKALMIACCFFAFSLNQPHLFFASSLTHYEFLQPVLSPPYCPSWAPFLHCGNLKLFFFLGPTRVKNVLHVCLRLDEAGVRVLLFLALNVCSWATQAGGGTQKPPSVTFYGLWIH